MKAALITGFRTMEFVEFPEPTASTGKAVVSVDSCGICGTDLHGFLSKDPYNPAICGHEFSGTVSAVASDVRHIKEGDRVVCGVSAACGRCPDCVAGRTNYCSYAFLNALGRDPLAPPHGAFAPSIAVDALRLIKTNASLSANQASIVEPATVAYHAVMRTLPRPDEVVLVQGCGPIGLLTLQVAKAAGAGRVIAIEPNELRRAKAIEVGADEAITPEAARERFGARGADLVFECAGVPPTIQVAVDLVRRGGRVNLVGLASGAATISPQSWLIKEVTLVASLAYNHHDFVETMNLMSDGRIAVDPLHDKTVGLSELPEAIALLADDPSSAIKVLVDPAL
ncbi:MAG: alcohol dehydrogenase [Actinobacteria bacterium]|jgi:(R,R)-butanediol dehydrogenase / meso-butanediol dehydrogenase / diacetyl reductase|nr:alcohol dehydrogenase [Actinomycetota bacterium]NBP53341.1 alcohol dehydrogenase [Actinomycetota bacterium]